MILDAFNFIINTKLQMLLRKTLKRFTLYLTINKLTKFCGLPIIFYTFIVIG